jgi:hypothetical protein
LRLSKHRAHAVKASGCYPSALDCLTHLASGDFAKNTFDGGFFAPSHLAPHAQK